VAQTSACVPWQKPPPLIRLYPVKPATSDSQAFETTSSLPTPASRPLPPTHHPTRGGLNLQSSPAKSISLLILFCLPTIPLAIAQQSSQSEATDVRTQMRNVMYHFTDKVAVHIKSLNGNLVPLGKNEFPIFDDKNSFAIQIANADISIRASDLANVMNSYVFAPPHQVLSGVSITVQNNILKVKGRLHQKGDIPFETDGSLTLTSDGKIRLHGEKIKALHLPVKGLMDFLGIDIAKLIKNGQVPGVEAEENDLILDVDKLLPPPKIQGTVTALRIQGDSIVLTFGKVDSKSEKSVVAGNYMSYEGNILRFGKLTMNDADMILIDMDSRDPFDFYLDKYKEQLTAGYSKTTPKFGLRVYMKDFNKLNRPTSNKKSASAKTSAPAN
jgi:hypothetical protein